MKMSSVMFLGFKAVAADSGVGAAQVAWFPGLIQGAEGVGDILRELGAGGGVDGIGGGKGFEGAELQRGCEYSGLSSGNVNETHRPNARRRAHRSDRLRSLSNSDIAWGNIEEVNSMAG
jgi:hypothetical protein